MPPLNFCPISEEVTQTTDGQIKIFDMRTRLDDLWTRCRILPAGRSPAYATGLNHMVL